MKGSGRPLFCPASVLEPLNPSRARDACSLQPAKAKWGQCHLSRLLSCLHTPHWRVPGHNLGDLSVSPCGAVCCADASGRRRQVRNQYTDSVVCRLPPAASVVGVCERCERALFSKFSVRKNAFQARCGVTAVCKKRNGILKVLHLFIFLDFFIFHRTPHAPASEKNTQQHTK